MEGTVKMICDNLSVNENGHLCFAGVDTIQLAKEYGTPLYVMDENKIREKCRIYLDSMRSAFGENALPLYASKAASFKAIYRIIKEEGLGVDVVSAGEIHTALSAGFDLSFAYFHSNNKTDEDIIYAIKNGIGYFVVDSSFELLAIDRIAKSEGICQKVLLRLTPGIDPHTYEAVATGKVDSKFGSAIETGQAEEITKLALNLGNIELVGFHCHVGSQMFDEAVFVDSAKVMLEFIADIKIKCGYATRELDLGGGFGVKYTEDDGDINIEKSISLLGSYVKAKCSELDIDMPAIRMEPGRSIVADAGLTLYTVGTVKEITGYKNYVSVDGGMSDNPRYALYGSSYTVLLANRMRDECNFKCSLVGRCCESGDILQENIFLPNNIKRGENIAVLTTGAYNYSMSSNYNRIPRPALVMLKDKKPYIAVKRETLENIIENDI